MLSFSSISKRWFEQHPGNLQKVTVRKRIYILRNLSKILHSCKRNCQTVADSVQSVRHTAPQHSPDSRLCVELILLDYMYRIQERFVQAVLYSILVVNEK